MHLVLVAGLFIGFVCQAMWIRQDAIKEGATTRDAFWVGLIVGCISLGVTVFVLNLTIY